MIQEGGRVVDEEPIRYRSEITPQFREDVRELYSSRPPWARPFYALLTLAMLGLAAWVPGWSSKLLYLFCAGVMALMLGPIMRLHWARWWPLFEREFGPVFDGEVTAAGIRIADRPHTVPWSSFIAGKSSEQAVLLYFNRIEALAFHRSQFPGEAAWEAFLARVHSGEVPNARRLPGSH